MMRNHFKFWICVHAEMIAIRQSRFFLDCSFFTSSRFCFCSFSSLCSRDSWVLCSRMQSIEGFFGHHNRNAVCGISNSNQFYATNKNAKWTAMVANQIMCANAENVCEWNEKIELTSIVIEISWSFAADLIWFINNFFVVLTRTHRMQCE